MAKDGFNPIMLLALSGIAAALILKRASADPTPTPDPDPVPTPDPEPIPNPLPPKAGDVVLNATNASNTVIIDVDNVTTKIIKGKMFVDIFDISGNVFRVFTSTENVNLDSLESKKITKATGLTAGVYNMIVSFTTQDDIDLAQINHEFVI